MRKHPYCTSLGTVTLSFGSLDVTSAIYLNIMSFYLFMYLWYLYSTTIIKWNMLDNYTLYFELQLTL